MIIANLGVNLAICSVDMAVDSNELTERFNEGWQTLEDQVFGKIEAFIANNNGSTN
jgi:hypothetical protein